MEQTTIPGAAGTHVAVLADDLIWASRLRAAIEHADATPVMARDAAALAVAAGDAKFAVVDLGGRAYDGIEAVRVAAGSGAVVLAVAQHEDVDLRKQALTAGAKRVLSYNKLFNDGPAVIAKLIATEL